MRAGAGEPRLVRWYAAGLKENPARPNLASRFPRPLPFESVAGATRPGRYFAESEVLPEPDRGAGGNRTLVPWNALCALTTVDTNATPFGTLLGRYKL